MTRILFVSTSTTLGGAEKTLYCLATLLDPQKFTVAGVVSLKPLGPYAERLKALGIPTHTLNLGGPPSWAQFRRLRRIVMELKPDIVHALMYQAIQLSRLVKRTGGKFKLFSSPRVSYRTRSSLTLMIDRLLKNSDDLVIAESDSSRNFLIKRGGYLPWKVRTIYNGVDIAQCPSSKIDRRRKRSELCLGADDILLGAIGRLDKQKGHFALIEAVARIKDRHPVRCVIIGEGPERSELEAQIRRLSLEKHVRLLGERDDITAWLSSFDLFVLPSLWEGLPNALLEAMAIGLPVVAASVDGICEVIDDNINGKLVPPEKPLALAQKIEDLLSDRMAMIRMGHAARKMVADKFSLVRMLADYESAYQQR